MMKKMDPEAVISTVVFGEDSMSRCWMLMVWALLQENGVEILTQHALAGVGEGTVALKQLPGGETVSVDADIVVMALGNRPDKAYEDKLAAAFDKVIVVGDATKAGTMADATKAAYEKCFYL